MPIAAGFVTWLVGLAASALVHRRARALLRQSRYVVGGILLGVSVMVLWLAISLGHEADATAAFVPSDPPNAPIGVARGIHPGRVVWVHEPNVSNWDGRTGNWWDDDNTDPNLTCSMVSAAIQSLTGEHTDEAAWDALFRHFNRAQGKGDVGYRPAEKIAIKINMNQDRDAGTPWRPDAGMPSPQVIYALLDQLIHRAGVPGRRITVYDAGKYIGDPIYHKVRAGPDPQFQEVRFEVVAWQAGRGREAAYEDSDAIVCFSDSRVPHGGCVFLPRCVADAQYLVNVALLRAHGALGVTLTAKNHFGSIRFPDLGWTAAPLHEFADRNSPMGSYNCLVDLIGHPSLGGKTLLFMIDALYGQADQDGGVIRFSSFGDNWCSSLFVSQDPLAIDSVGLDFLRNEPQALYCQRSVSPDNYLHEAALAYYPPSGTFYDPDGDGRRLKSLGVHEHWNNFVDKQYSRNLGTGAGIELVVVGPGEAEHRANANPADLTLDGEVDAGDLQVLFHTWLAERGTPRWNGSCDLSGDEHIDLADLAVFSPQWRSQRLVP